MSANTLLRILRIGDTVQVNSAALAGCGKGSSPATTAAAQRVGKPGVAGVAIYGKALAAQESEQGLGLLEPAIRANLRLAEACYELGRRKVRLAPDLV